jgi:hypothetical protein
MTTNNNVLTSAEDVTINASGYVNRLPGNP